MRLISIFIFVLFVLVPVTASAQKPKAEPLHKKINDAHNPEQKIEAYFALAQEYFLVDRSRSDSLAFLATTLAEQSRDRTLIVHTTLRNADRLMLNFTVRSNTTEANKIISQALVLSRTSNDFPLMLVCYNKLARLYRGTGEPDKALQANSEAISLLPEIKDDSLKVITYNNYGSTLYEKKDMLGAFKEYLNALTIAEQSKRQGLIRPCYEQLSAFYKGLHNYEKSKDYAFQLLNQDLADKTRDPQGIMDDYFRIAEIYVSAKDIKMALFYFGKCEHIADSVHSNMMSIDVKLSKINMFLNSNKFEEGYSLLRNSPEIFRLMRSSGMEYEIDKANAYIQMKLGNMDSSLYYYKRAEPHYNDGGSNAFNNYGFYSQYTLLFIEQKKWDKAIEMSKKALELIKPTGHIEIMAQAYETLDSLYYYKGDFKEAYRYHSEYQKLKDSLETLSKGSDLQSLEIDNENKRKSREATLAAEELNRKHNLQYMAITVAIGVIFILLVFLGLLKVSTAVVKAIGFFAFIFLFEFIILIADNQIHHLTHGEPWKVLMIKIVLIAMLLPFHHWIEEKVVHLLISNRHKLAERISRMRKPVKTIETENEEGV